MTARCRLHRRVVVLTGDGAQHRDEPELADAMPLTLSIWLRHNHRHVFTITETAVESSVKYFDDRVSAQVGTPVHLGCDWRRGVRALRCLRLRPSAVPQADALLCPRCAGARQRLAGHGDGTLSHFAAGRRWLHQLYVDDHEYARRQLLHLRRAGASSTSRCA
jgi:hypothetical protein